MKIKYLLLFVFASVLTISSFAKKKQSPNIVIIFNDDMGYADVACFGAEKIKTPNIDNMAVDGRMVGVVSGKAFLKAFKRVYQTTRPP